MSKDKAIKDPELSNAALTVGGKALGRGHEEPSEQEDLEIPRAKLIQSTSDEATAENPDDRIQTGKIVNSMTKEFLPEVFLPIFKFTNWIRWNPRKKDDPNYDPAHDPGAMIFATTNGQDPRVLEGKDFGPNGEPPKVTKYLNFFSYFPGHTMPLILSFAKTSFAAGKRLNSLTQFYGGDMFANQFKLCVCQQERAGTKFFVFEIKPAGKAKKEDFAIAEKWFETFRGRSLKVHDQDKPEDWSE